MSTAPYASDTNLLDLRDDLTNRIALWQIVFSWLILLYVAFFDASVVLVVLLIMLILIGLAVRQLAGKHSRLARQVLVWGQTIVLLVGMAISINPMLPFLGLPIIITAVFLLSAGGFAVAIAIIVSAMLISVNQDRGYPLSEFVLSVSVGLVVTWLLVRTLYTAIEWLRNTNQRSQELLKIVSNQRSELTQTVKSLEHVNVLQNRTQNELILARRQAIEARQATEQFAANISHELRTPLNIILGFSEMMQLSPESYGDMRWPPPLRQAVYHIYRSSRHLTGMIDDILDLSRLDAGVFTLGYESTPMMPLIQDVVDIVTDLFAEQGIQLVTDLPEHLPTLDIDRTRIRQVILNLLNNARRFADGRDVKLQVEQYTDQIVISVTDQGPGIPEDKLPHIFEEFYQVDQSLHRNHGGAGLGLAICKRFVEAHGGHIWVDSTLGVGSNFSFSLPIVTAITPALQTVSGAVANLSEKPPLHPILVVDSDPAVASLLRRHLETHGIIRVEPDDNLVEQVELHHPRAVILNTPPGRRPGRQISLFPLPVPLIECSIPSASWTAETFGVAACLTKPVSASLLVEEVMRVGQSRKVLVVDDEPGFCHLTKQILESRLSDVAVRMANTAEAGLNAMRMAPPDLVLMDIVMPGLDGFGALEKMRQEPMLADIPVILLSATSFSEDVLERQDAQLIVRRQNGLSLQDLLESLQALINVLDPHYDEFADPVTASRQNSHH
jgi:signal transduction histidine kinase